MREGEIGGRSAKCVIAVGAFKSIFSGAGIIWGFGALISFAFLGISGSSDAYVL